eukprot:scaffold73326_cov33-Phaeocystis_antarctica.AAC.1
MAKGSGIGDFRGGSSSTRGSGWAPRAARRALRRHRSRAGALPKGHFGRAVAQPRWRWRRSSGCR